MKSRKLILTVAIAVLAVIYAIQLALTNRSPVKTFSLKEGVDSITIETNGQSLSLSLEGGLWYVVTENGTKKDAGDDKKIEELASAVKSIKSLSTVSRSNAQTELERYGFADVTTINVTAVKNGKTVRTLKIGKNAGGSANSFIRLNDNTETLLATGSLRSVFDVSAEDLILKADSEQAENQANIK